MQQHMLMSSYTVHTIITFRGAFNSKFKKKKKYMSDKNEKKDKKMRRVMAENAKHQQCTVVGKKISKRKVKENSYSNSSHRAM